MKASLPEVRQRRASSLPHPEHCESTSFSLRCGNFFEINVREVCEHATTVIHPKVKPLTMRHLDGTVSREPHEEPLTIPSAWMAYDNYPATVGPRKPTRTEYDERHACSKIRSKEYLTPTVDKHGQATVPRTKQYYTKPARRAPWDPKRTQEIVGSEYRQGNSSVAKSRWAGHFGLDDARYGSAGVLHFGRSGCDVVGPFMTSIVSSIGGQSAARAYLAAQ